MEKTFKKDSYKEQSGNYLREERNSREERPSRHSFNPNFDRNNRVYGDRGNRNSSFQSSSDDAGRKRRPRISKDSSESVFSSKSEFANSPYSQEFNNESSFSQRDNSYNNNRRERSFEPRERSSYDNRERSYEPRENRSFGNRERSFEPRERRSFQPREERPFQPREERSFQPRENRSFGNRERSFEPRENRSYGNRERSFEPRERSSYNRNSYSDRSDNRSYGYQDREERSFNRSQGGRNERGGSGYNSRSNDNRNNRYNDRSQNNDSRGSRFAKRDNTPFSLEPVIEGEVRLNRFVAMSGICSRREADELIVTGQISVNGEVVSNLGTKVTSNDVVTHKDKVLKGEKLVYIVMNKPKNCVTTVEDPNAEVTVIDLLKGKVNERVFPVGRLDKNSMGVIILTNDGELTKELTHPSYEKKKIYHLFLDKNVESEDIEKLAEGIELEDGPIYADELSYVEDNPREVGIEIHSGRNRIVRRMFEHIGYKVLKLDRVYFAGITKKGLKRGFWRYLTAAEVMQLKNRSIK